MNKYMLQALSGVKEIKLYGNSNFFLNKWEIEFKGNIKTNRFITILKSIPRFIFESVSIITICLILIIQLFILIIKFIIHIMFVI